MIKFFLEMTCTLWGQYGKKLLKLMGFCVGYIFIYFAIVDFNSVIQLPPQAHNTVGEIPLVEHYDDGDVGGKSGYPQETCLWSTDIVYTSTLCPGDTISFDNFN